MASSLSRTRLRPSRGYSRGRSGYRASSRVPGHVVATAVGAVLVLLTGLLVLGPVLGLVGAAAATGPVVDVPVASSTVAVVLGFVAAAVLLLLGWRSHRSVVAWTLAVTAWLVSLVASVWPLVATADAAVDRARDIWPFIVEIVRSVG